MSFEQAYDQRPLLVGPSTAHVEASRTVPAATVTVTVGAQPAGTTAPRAAAQPGTQKDTNGQIASQVTHQAPLGAGAMVWLQYLMGFIAPLILGGIALYLTRGPPGPEHGRARNALCALRQRVGVVSLFFLR